MMPMIDYENIDHMRGDICTDRVQSSYKEIGSMVVWEIVDEAGALRIDNQCSGRQCKRSDPN